MTKTASRLRNRLVAIPPEAVMLVLILAVASWLRLDGVGFGLPALNDPDEPVFMMTAFEMLRDHTLNPGWFGHPGTTTITCLALLMLAVGAIGVASGRFADADAFAGAVYADPGIVFLPGRVLIVCFGVLGVWLTYRLGRRIGGRWTGLAAAGFLAINAVHVEYSQIIRTDVMASAFMLAATLAAVRIARRGEMQDYLLAGALVGLACATKWPAVLIAFSPGCAALWRGVQGDRGWRKPAAMAAAAPAALLLASPYLLLDYPTVLSNLAGEARPIHPGATGDGFLRNLWWYVAGPLRGSFGLFGVVGGFAGLALLAWRKPAMALAVLPGPLVFLTAICAQPLIWERWVLPIIPFVAIGLAWALHELVEVLARTRQRQRAVAAVTIAAFVGLAIPMALQMRARAAERDVDTRQLASSWVRKHIAPGSTILLEQAAIDLIGGPWRLRFPLGGAGCIDARAALSGQIRFSEAEGRQAGRPALDLGYLGPEKLAQCRADYAIISRYTLYAADPARFGPQLAQYRALTAGGQPLATFRPSRGKVGGPPVMIVRLPPKWAPGPETEQAPKPREALSRSGRP